MNPCLIKKLIHCIIAREERRFSVPLNHLRELADTSVTAFIKLLLLAPLANHRRRLPRAAWHLARLAVTHVEDCGACVQIALYLARRDGVDEGLLRAALTSNAGQLSPELRDVVRFAAGIARGQDAPELRDRLEQHYGFAAVVELSLAIATSRFFPAFKRALGHSESCNCSLR